MGRHLAMFVNNFTIYQRILMSPEEGLHLTTRGSPRTLCLPSDAAFRYSTTNTHAEATFSFTRATRTPVWNKCMQGDDATAAVARLCTAYKWEHWSLPFAVLLSLVTWTGALTLRLEPGWPLIHPRKIVYFTHFQIPARNRSNSSLNTVNILEEMTRENTAKHDSVSAGTQRNEPPCWQL